MKSSPLPVIVKDLLAQKTVRASVQLAVGELVSNEAQLKLEWIGLTKRTPLANTKLNIRMIPAEQQCMWCFLVYHPGKKDTTCPQCRSVGAKILSGEEFYLEAD